MFDFDLKEMLKDGAKGEGVEMLQKALKATGFDPGEADGMFGGKTKAALEAMQSKAGLSADGIFGPQSKEAITKMLKDKAGDAAGDMLKKQFGAVGGLFGKK